MEVERQHNLSEKWKLDRHHQMSEAPRYKDCTRIFTCDVWRASKSFSNFISCVFPRIETSSFSHLLVVLWPFSLHFCLVNFLSFFNKLCDSSKETPFKDLVNIGHLSLKMQSPAASSKRFFFSTFIVFSISVSMADLIWIGCDMFWNYHPTTSIYSVVTPVGIFLSTTWCRSSSERLKPQCSL